MNYINLYLPGSCCSQRMDSHDRFFIRLWWYRDVQSIFNSNVCVFFSTCYLLRSRKHRVGWKSSEYFLQIQHMPMVTCPTFPNLWHLLRQKPSSSGFWGSLVFVCGRRAHWCCLVRFWAGKDWSLWGRMLVQSSEDGPPQLLKKE